MPSESIPEPRQLWPGWSPDRTSFGRVDIQPVCGA